MKLRNLKTFRGVRHSFMLENILANPDQPILTLPLLSEAQKYQLLVEWNHTQADYPKDGCIHQLFEAQVQRTPEAIAVVFESEKVTYRELNCRANQLAHYLRTLGVGPDVLVGIIVERSLEMVVGLLGILKAGGAYVPLDPAYPLERLAFMLEDAQVSVLLTQQHLVAGLPEHGALVVCLDVSGWNSIAQSRQENPKSSAMADDLAYVIYTSGSTGKPKGVQIPHRAVVNFLLAMLDQPGLTSQDILLAVTSLSFDIAANELFLPLLVGARLVVVSREVATSGALLQAKLYECGATVLQATPATWRLILAAGWQGYNLQGSSRGVGRLKVLCGGESLDRELANQLLERGAVLWNLYGPTETTIWSATYLVEPKAGLVPIGRPIANTQIYLLDLHLQPVPIAVPGEVYICGAGLAQGYLNRPELTAERFIPNPFSDQPGVRFYKTGDSARYLPDGNIEFLGRIDNQVKIRGFRIEPGEIETVLSRHPAVFQAVVVAREDVPGDKRLVAYLVPHQEQVLKSTELRRFLKQNLPEYMIPSAFVLLDTLPLTPNSKVDRQALLMLEQERLEQEEAFVPPQDALELQLTKIWEEVLGVQPIGMRDNFFELGGESLLAVRLFAQIEKTFNKALPLLALFQAQTVEQLANILRQDGWQSSWFYSLPVQPHNFKAASVLPSERVEQLPNLPYQEAQNKTTCKHNPELSPQEIRELLASTARWTGRRLGSNFLLMEINPYSPGSKPPFFWVNEGDHLWHLGADQPVYYLPYGFITVRDPATYIKALASLYVDEICSVQPNGPYFLGGYCFTGLVALEIAHQLQAQGQEVALLALLQTYGPNPLLRLYYQTIGRTIDHWRRLQQLNRAEQLAYVLERVRRIMDRTLSPPISSLGGNDNPRSTQSYLSNDADAQFGLGFKQAEQFYHYNYRPQVYSGRVALFFGDADGYSPSIFPQGGWEKFFTGRLDIQVIPGEPMSMLTGPNAPLVAEKLRVYLNTAWSKIPNR